MNMRTVTLVHVLILLFSCDFVGLPSYEQIKISHEGNDFSSFSSRPWETVCLSSQYELPDLVVGNYGVEQCWNTNEVSAGSIFISYLSSDKTCERKVVSGYLFSKQNSESRCFTSKEAKNLMLIRKDSIISFKIKDQKE